MAFFTQVVPIPVWLLIIMLVVILAALTHFFKILIEYLQGNIFKEEHSDMVVWTVKSRKRTAVPKKKPVNTSEVKAKEQKAELTNALKILLQEGDKGVLLQTIADRMGASTTNARHALQKLVDNRLVDEVVGVSGTKYYLTQEGKEYCRRKAK